MVINLDYLQINCRGILHDTKRVKILTAGHGTRQFYDCGFIEFDGKKIGTYSRSPVGELRNGALHEDSVIIKIENSLLYVELPELRRLVEDLFSQFENWRVVGLSRFDIAGDFQKFDNGLKPLVFIRGFMREDYLKNSRGVGRLDFKHNRRIMPHDLRFGTHESLRSCYLYNKTYEMSCKKQKTYIQKCWDNCPEISPLEDVWRLEVTFKGNRHTIEQNAYIPGLQAFDIGTGKKYFIKRKVERALYDKATGKMKTINDFVDLEILELERVLEDYKKYHFFAKDYVLFRAVRWFDLFDFEFIKTLYFAALDKDFSFVISDKQKNKARMKRLELFNYNYAAGCKISTYSDSKDATRMNRIIIKHLHLHLQDIKGVADVMKEGTKDIDNTIFTSDERRELLERFEEMKLIMSGGDKLLKRYVDIFDLEKYYKKIKQLNT